MTPYDKQKIEQILASKTRDIKALIELCDGRQRFSPADKERARYEYESLKSSLQGLATHIFDTDTARIFCDRAGGDIAEALTAKAGDSPEAITRCLGYALGAVSYRLDRLSKYPVVD